MEPIGPYQNLQQPTFEKLTNPNEITPRQAAKAYALYLILHVAHQMLSNLKKHQHMFNGQS